MSNLSTQDATQIVKEAYFKKTRQKSQIRFSAA